MEIIEPTVVKTMPDGTRVVVMYNENTNKYDFTYQIKYENNWRTLSSYAIIDINAHKLVVILMHLEVLLTENIDRNKIDKKIVAQYYINKFIEKNN